MMDGSYREIDGVAWVEIRNEAHVCNGIVTSKQDKLPLGDVRVRREDGDIEYLPIWTPLMNEDSNRIGIRRIIATPI